jgi:UDP-N-acetylmuramate dehydrogenase
MSSSISWPCAALRSAELADRTTMHVGGRVEWLLEPANPEELRGAWVRARELGFRPRILGGGANLIIGAEELEGVVLSTARLRYIFRPGRDADPQQAWIESEGEGAAPSEEPRLVAWCGATLPSVVRTATELGWSGLEGLAGVPGNLGGGVAMNAGGRWGDMWDVVESVRVLDADGRLVDLARQECSPSYRNGGMGENIVVGAVLRFEHASRLEVRERVRTYLLEKRRVQPVTEWSAGCVFKNPDPELSGGRSAGKLVDDCGGKSRQRGDAIVSPLHGNFIVNQGAATSADVLTLIEDLRDLVAQKTGLRLETEVKIWG